MITSPLILIKNFPQKLKAPLTALYKRQVVDSTLLEALSNAASLTKPDMQILTFALGVAHMRQNSVPIIDALRMAKEQNRKINLYWSPKRWKDEHDRLSRFATLKRLSAASTSYDLSTYRELLPDQFSGYLISSSGKLGAEGLRQRHCVASWHDRIASGLLAIVTLFVKKKRFTAELMTTGAPERSLNLGQIRGRFNVLPTKEESKYMHEMLGVEKQVYRSPLQSIVNDDYLLNMNRVIPVLQGLNVSKVVIRFEGGGDSGCIESSVFYGESGNEIDGPVDQVEIREKFQRWEDGIWIESSCDVLMPLPEAVNQIVDSWLDSTSVDWYNNDGGFGECVINVENSEISLDVSVRYTETEEAYYQEYEFSELDEIAAG